MDLKVFLNHYNAILINDLIALANVPQERYVLFTFHNDRSWWKTTIFKMAINDFSFSDILGKSSIFK